MVGPFLAYSAISNHLEVIRPLNLNNRKLSHSIRKMLISLRKRLVNPKIITLKQEVEVIKEVIKEVEVEKVVHETIEIPTPVEVTRFIGVPVPKSPEELPEFNPEKNNLFKSIQVLGEAK